MYDIRLVDEADLYDLLVLHQEFRNLISPESKNSECVNQFMAELYKPDAMVVGVFYRCNLVGFQSGYGKSSNVYYYSCIYVRPSHRIKVKELIEKAEAFIPEQYTSWEATSWTKEGQNLITRFGAKEVSINYKKEL